MKSPLLLLALAMIVGCGSSSQNDSQAWVAKVNKRKITVEEFEQTLGRIGKLTIKDYTQEAPRRELIKDLVDKELLFQKALEEKIYENSLYLKDQMVQEYLRKHVGNVAYNPTEDEIKKLYDEKKSELEKVRVSHILIKPKKTGDAASEAEAKKKAEKILSELRSKGSKADFSEFAKKYSEDAGSKDQGGDIMFFKKQDMVPEFSEAAFKLANVGDLSDIVHTQFGYHIIKLTGDNRGLESLKPQIIHSISKQKQKEKAEELLAKLRSNATVKVNDEALLKSAAPKTAPEVK